MRRRIAYVSLLVVQGASAQDAIQGPSAEASTPSARAAARDAGERVVLLVGSLHAPWIARARGQLSDLPVVVVEERDVSSGDADAEQRHAQHLAQERGADVVAWLASDSPAARQSSSAVSQAELRIWLARPARLYRHRLGRPWAELSAEDRSAALEIAALTLRSAVRASTHDVAHAPASPAREEAASAVAWRVGLGASWQLDGVTDLGMAAASAEFAVVWQRWSLGGGGSFGFPAAAAAEGAELRLSRHAAFLQASYALLDGPSFSCAGLLRGGLAVYRRETRALTSNALPLPARTLSSALLAGGARGSWHISATQALTLTLAATWQLAPPYYSIERLEPAQIFEYPLWTFSPAIELGWTITL